MEREKNIYCILFFLISASILVTSTSGTSINEATKKSEINSVHSDKDTSTKSYKDLMNPLQNLPELIFGVDTAPSTIVVYLSFTCTYCKKFFINELPKLKQAVDKGEIKIIIRPFIDTNLSQETTAIIKCLCDDSKEKLEKLFLLAFERQEDLMKIITENDLYHFLHKILPQANISHELIANYKNNQKIHSGIMIDHYKTTYNSEISSAPALLIRTNNEISVYQGFLTSNEIIQKIIQLNTSHQKLKN